MDQSFRTSFERYAQQYHARIRVEVLLPGLMVRVRPPGLEEANEVGERVFSSVPGFVILRDARQARRVARKLAKGYSPDVVPLLQLGDAVGNGIVEP